MGPGSNITEEFWESIMSNKKSPFQLERSSGSFQTSEKQLVLSTTYLPRIRTNITLPNPVEIYVPDDDESVPYAFMLGMHTFRTAEGCEKALLSGYFSVLCAVLPDLKKIAYEILESLGFLVKEIGVPSQKDVNYTTIPQFDNRVEVLSFAQLLYIPYITCFESTEEFWGTVAENAGIHHPIYLFRESDVKALLSALKTSRLDRKLGSELYLSQQALGAMNTHFGRVFSEASKRVRFEETNRRNYIYGTYTYCME